VIAINVVVAIADYMFLAMPNVACPVIIFEESVLRKMKEN
jgi:hypothetical protein